MKQRINGCKMNLSKLTDTELFYVGEYIRRKLDQLEEQLAEVDAEMVRRGILHEPAV